MEGSWGITQIGNTWSCPPSRLVIQGAGATLGVQIRIVLRGPIGSPHPRTPLAVMAAAGRTQVCCSGNEAGRREVCRMQVVQRFLSSNGFSPTGSLQQVLTKRAIVFLQGFRRIRFIVSLSGS